MVVSVGSFAYKNGTVLNEGRHNGNGHEDKEGASVKQKADSILK